MVSGEGYPKQPEKVHLLNELSGALGDLGTFLPHVLAAITIIGLNPSSIFTGFGLFYLFSGWFYGIPMAVQPMKVASAAVLVGNFTPGEVAAAGLIIGAIMLVLGITGLIDRLARITPVGVTGGIQVGLGLSLAVLGLRMVSKDPLLGWIILAGMLPLLASRRFPASIFALLVGTALGWLLHPGVSFPSLSLGLDLPQFIWPAPGDFQRGFFEVVMPQIPLTLTNAVLVTAALAADLYGSKAARVTERNLSLTMGLGNLLAAPLGGYMMCHGSGGIAAHHRFGGRTRATAFIIGFILILVGLLLGSDGIKLLQLVPEAVLGSLLFFSGLDLALAARSIENRHDLFLTLFVAALSLALNPAIAFIAGLITNKGINLKVIRP